MKHCNCYKQTLNSGIYENITHAEDCPAEDFNELLEALEEIAKGEGAFSRDQLTHASNVIENMVSIAKDTLENVKGEYNEN